MYGGWQSKRRPGGEYVLQLSFDNFLAVLLIFQTSQSPKKPLALNRAYNLNERLLV